MGVDLTLYPEMHLHEDMYPYVKLELGRWYDLHDKIRDLDPQRLPPKIRFHKYDDEDGLAVVGVDAYGSPLTYVTAGELSKIELGTECKYPYTRAAWAYLRELPADTMVALWWH